LVGNYNVTPSWKWPSGQRKQGVSAHDHRISGGNLLETFQVVEQVKQQFVIFSDGKIFGNGHND